MKVYTLAEKQDVNGGHGYNFTETVIKPVNNSDVGYNNAEPIWHPVFTNKHIADGWAEEIGLEVVELELRTH